MRLGMFGKAERWFAVSFFGEFLRLVATDILRHVGKVSAKESDVLVHHEIFVGKFIIKKISFTLLKGRQLQICHDQFYFIHLLCLRLIIKITMSTEKLPHLAKPLFKNMLQKQQISHRMQIHKLKIDQVSRSKSKFLEPFDHDPNQTYRTLFEQNPKKNQMMQTKYLQIERQNKYLFQKIKKAHKKSKSKKSQSPSSMERVKSMNITMRKKQIEQIQIDNVRLLNRIAHQKPSISFKQTDKQYNKKRRLSQKLSKIQKYRLEDWY